MEETPQRVLVVTPHPDDAEFWCGGTIAKWISEGATVHYVLCTDGSKGTSDRSVRSEDLVARREREQREAAQVLGVEDVVELHHPDGELEDTRDFRRELVRQIRLVRPDVVWGDHARRRRRESFRRPARRRPSRRPDVVPPATESEVETTS